MNPELIQARRIRTYLWLLVAVTVCLSFFVWMRQSITLDEAQSVWQVSRSLGDVFNVIAKDVHVPLYFVGLHFWIMAFGTSAAALRSFSLIFTVMSIPAVFSLAREAYSTRVAYMMALMTAISPFFGWYGSEARMYSLMFLFTILSHLYFIRIWQRPSRSAWVSYTMVTFFGLFTHLFFLFVLFTQAVFFLAKREIFPRGSMKRFVWIAVTAGAACLAWFVYRHVAGAGLTNPLLAAPSSVDFFNVFSNFFIGFQTDAVNTVFLSLWPLLVFVGFTFLAKKRSKEPQTVYLVMASFLPVFLAFLISTTFEPIFLARYLIICLPSTYLLALYFISLYRGAVGDILYSALIACMLAMLVVQAIQPLSPIKEDFRDASAAVADSATPSDLFVVAAPFTTYPVEYYYDGAARLTTFPTWNRFASDASAPQTFSLQALTTDTQSWQKVYQKVYILLGYDQGYNEKIRLYMDTHYQRLATQTFSPNLSLYVYKLRYP